MRVRVITVAYRSAAHLRACVEPLCRQPDLEVVVVDNDCPERSPELVADLPVEVVAMGRNAGFGAACNAGAAAGDAEALLFLNPDARIEPDAVRALAAAVGERRVGAAGPRILDDDGATVLSARRDPRLRSALAEALFVHHLLPRAAWTTEFVRDGYEARHEAEWLSGAALCVRRDAFERVGGFDERFFLYSEDTDLCRRLRDAGFLIVYEPSAIARHSGGASAEAGEQLPLRSAARLLYARLHMPPLRSALFRATVVLHELLRLPLAGRRSRSELRGRAVALSRAVGRYAGPT